MPENKPEHNNMNQPPRRFFNRDSYSNLPTQDESDNSKAEVETQTTVKTTIKGSVISEEPVITTSAVNAEKGDSVTNVNQKSSDSFSGENSSDKSGDVKKVNDTFDSSNNKSSDSIAKQEGQTLSSQDSDSQENNSSIPDNNENHGISSDDGKGDSRHSDVEKPNESLANNGDSDTKDEKKPFIQNKNDEPEDESSTKDELQNKNSEKPTFADSSNVKETQNSSQNPAQHGLRRNGSKDSQNKFNKKYRKNPPIAQNATSDQNNKKSEDDNKSEKQEEDKLNKAAEAAKKKKQEAKEAKKKAQRIRRIIRNILLHWKLYLILGLIFIFILFLAILVVVLNTDSSGKFGGGMNGDGNVSGPIDRSPGITDSYKCEETISVPISVKTTPLTRDEFIQKVKTYQPSSFRSQYANFQSHAGDIYDLAIGNGYNGKNALGVNPEMVVIRAFNEGFAPGTGYNYWGIGKCNTCSGGGKYSSFMDGVEAYFKTIMKYDEFNKDDIYGVMGKYAYIGDNWYYPGDSGKGGCYYKKYIIKFLEVINHERANEVERICREGTQDKTTADDQLAYAQYQVETNIMSFRKSIFGLGNDTDSSTCNKLIVTLDPPTPEEIKKLTELTETNGGPIYKLLSSNKSSLESFNEGLSKTVIDSTPGSRKSVVNAAIYTINTFYSLGYRLPYSFSGGHDAPYTNKTGAHHDRTSSNYFGINPYIGEEIWSNHQTTRGYKNYRNGKEKWYYYLGLDCSGFVSWALKNGGIDRPVTNASGFKNDPNVKTYDFGDNSKYIGQPGDVLASESHVALIIRYDSNKKAYLVAEESSGLIVNYYRLDSEYSQKNYKVVDMSYYYDNKKINNYAAAFKEGVYKV